MFRLFLRSVCVFIGLAGAATAQDSATLAQAVRAANAGDWSAVSRLSQDIRLETSRDVVDWMRLRARQGSFDECRAFLQRHSNWPGLPLLRQRCEYSIARTANPTAVLEFFNGTLPQTGVGSLRYAAALIAVGQSVEAARELQRGWLTFNMSQEEHDAFVDRNGRTIAQLHEERLDLLLWRGSDAAAERMLPLVSDGWKRLAAARIGLRNQAGGVNGLIERVPRALRDDPGLAYERFVWRARRGLDDRAVEMLLSRSTSVEALGKPEEWAKRRRSLARQMMREGKSTTAYRAASTHFLESGSDFADLEWLSGYIALRKLDDPATALEHFNRFEAAVFTPISLGRAGYWTGRAYEAAGDTQAANEAYARGAKYQSSFYGQLAAERIGLPTDLAMAGTETFGDWRQAGFTKSTVFAAAIRLQAAGQRSLAERFLVHLAESQDRDALGQMGDLALDLREPHIALMVSKQAARMGHELYKTYFPLGLPDGLEKTVPEEFILSIARRESEFDPVVVSPVNAKGLMQILPGTARDMARRLGEPFSEAALLSDPAYNARLGIAFLTGLATRYNNNPVLMAVAYNAGPRRADDWIAQYGDPRSDRVDVVDWIEGIPFRETRNYVMRVTESFAPYRARLNAQVAPLNLTADLVR